MPTDPRSGSQGKISWSYADKFRYCFVQPVRMSRISPGFDQLLGRPCQEATASRCVLFMPKPLKAE